MLKVLIVEDTATFQLIVRRQLTALGINSVETASDGLAALDLIRREPDVDVILCDWHMAPMDGLAFCAAVQKVPYLRGRHIPVVFMTSDAKLVDPVKRQRALAPAQALGITDILIKPFTIADLGAVLTRCAGYRPY
jgi:CheY-like chemotaxis protein